MCRSPINEARSKETFDMKKNEKLFLNQELLKNLTGYESPNDEDLYQTDCKPACQPCSVGLPLPPPCDMPI